MWQSSLTCIHSSERLQLQYCAAYKLNSMHGRRPRQNSRRDNKMLYFTSIYYAVHEYQTLKQKQQWNKFWGDYNAFLFPIFFSSPLFCPTFRTCSQLLRAGVSWVLWVLLPVVRPSEARPLNISSAFYCALLCLMPINGCAETVIIL